ncbi:G1/S-specific cyclin-E isoform X1 [Drosophila gunungcola]|uniref:G1/S-specific cyclin-E isoform X1 n=1 Tax=Drosophila gunungcola TaxID=103775 RepID=UPI0022E30423|nr:G1/S-specific cyclin-E isoform X1 [Drosophila gunungcola]XP_052852396.1 G1/S-specific cyclin-E isoform X1 [Drosophila gunungcola]XP_052852397.1 G1/S-specific cyclin-E isoform X1 [Drosophila gunungcola]
MGLNAKSVCSTSSTEPNGSIVTTAPSNGEASSSSIVVVVSSSSSNSSSSSSICPNPIAIPIPQQNEELPGTSAASKKVEMCSCDNQNLATSSTAATSNGNKRKRRLSSYSNDDAKDPELGFEPPSAKRQQRLPALYCSDQSNLSSVASSVYTSPGQSTQELLSIRSSPAEELPEAPHSPLPDSPDSPPSPDRGAKQPPVVVRYGVEQVVTTTITTTATTTVVTQKAEEDDLLDDSCEDYSYDEDDGEEEDEDEDEEIYSSTISPASSGCSQQQAENGQRTPGLQQHQQPMQHPVSEHLMINMMAAPTKTIALDDAAAFSCMSPAVENALRQCPLPALNWANAADVWRLMCQRDEQDSSLRSISMLEQHPGLQPRMRAILLDWLIEVCEVYKLHRETFYLAVDYLDRYLHVARKVQKTHLQLIGITCLFVAAKVEEIYPPKIGEFAYVTDGACTERDILNHEKILLQALDWDISPITITGWLGVYMQLNVNNRTPASFSQIGRQKATEADDAFIYPQFSGFEFVQTSQLLDLCTLDVGMANYSYSVLAAAAISHTFSREASLRCSGLDWQVIQPCARWMEPFFRVVSQKATFLQLNEQNEQVSNKFGLGHICPNIVTDDSHIIQTHTTTMDMYDEVLMAQDAAHAMRARIQASPATALRAHESLLTPPASSHKPDEYLGDEGDETAARSGITCNTASSNSSCSNSNAISSSNNNPVTSCSSRSNR